MKILTPLLRSRYCRNIRKLDAMARHAEHESIANLFSALHKFVEQGKEEEAVKILEEYWNKSE